jgi:hypothetical protein
MFACLAITNFLLILWSRRRSSVRVELESASFPLILAYERHGTLEATQASLLVGREKQKSSTYQPKKWTGR